MKMNENDPSIINSQATSGFGIGEDFIEGYQSLDEHFLQNKISTFFFKAPSDSMDPTICKGEIILVDRSIRSFNGKVCIVAFEGRLICRRVYRNTYGLTLKADNPKYKNIRVQSSESIDFWGVVTSRHGHVL